MKIKNLNIKIVLKIFAIIMCVFTNLAFQQGTHSTNLQEKFSEIYKNNGWGDKESKSGGGSNIAITKTLQEHLPKIIKAYNIKTLLDAPCGDFNWMKEVNLGVEKYIGIDIVPEMIDFNNKNYKNKINSFEVKNLVTDNLPKVDLIFCRDCLMHLNEDDVKHVINNFKASGSKYLLTTTYVNRDKNNEYPINNGSFYYPINLTIAPFNLPRPLLLLQDVDSYYNQDKYLGLWELKDINCF